MLDFHTILLPKNSRTTKISRRKKGLNIRIHEKEESNTFVVGTPLSGCRRSNTGNSIPPLRQPCGFIGEHPKGVPPGLHLRV